MRAQRPRNKELFVGPKVLISEGTENLKTAFCADSVLFKDALVSITGPQEDEDALRFLTAAIASDVLKSYLFHTSSNWGIYRPEILLEERLSVPFYLPEFASSPVEARALVADVVLQMKSFEKEMERVAGFGQNEAAQALQNRLESSIREYYGVDAFESMLIDDTVKTIIPSSTPNASASDIPTLRPVTHGQQIEYADTFCDAIAAYCGKDTIGKPRKGPYAATIFPGSPYSIIRIDKVSHPRKTATEKSPQSIHKTLHRLQPLLDQPRGKFVFCQNLKVFCDDALYVLKPAQYRFWMRTAALNDADEIAGAILLGMDR